MDFVFDSHEGVFTRAFTKEFGLALIRYSKQPTNQAFYASEGFDTYLILHKGVNEMAFKEETSKDFLFRLLNDLLEKYC